MATTLNNVKSELAKKQMELKTPACQSRDACTLLPKQANDELLGLQQRVNNDLTASRAEASGAVQTLAAASANA